MIVSIRYQLIWGSTRELRLFWSSDPSSSTACSSRLWTRFWLCSQRLCGYWSHLTPTRKKKKSLCRIKHCRIRTKKPTIIGPRHRVTEWRSKTKQMPTREFRKDTRLSSSGSRDTMTAWSCLRMIRAVIQTSWLSATSRSWLPRCFTICTTSTGKEEQAERNW